MKRAALWGVALVTALSTAGCPIYPEDPYACNSSSDCGPGRVCDLPSGVCYLPNPPASGGNGGGSSGGVPCSSPDECGINETCSAEGQCRIGDCSFHGCVNGYRCELDGAFLCVSTQDASVGNDAGQDASTQTDGGTPDATVADAGDPDADTADADVSDGDTGDAQAQTDADSEGGSSGEGGLSTDSGGVSDAGVSDAATD